MFIIFDVQRKLDTWVFRKCNQHKDTAITSCIVVGSRLHQSKQLDELYYAGYEVMGNNDDTINNSYVLETYIAFFPAMGQYTGS
mmetsp:Transcript_1831/g.2904  ORF Transcript_1831/g.2904 Transcript_1831/m.2904 type:complete len:84 (-) Transcript_1831:2046-2297(-)